MRTVLEKLKKVAKGFPDKPGVYFWRDAKGKPLYIGRAGSLKKRVASYFIAKDARIAEMVSQARKLDYQQTETLLEAVILEANLIKKHWPKYNVREKDDKSFIYLVITKDPSTSSGQGEFPRLVIVRGRELEKSLPAMPDSLCKRENYSSFIKGGGRRPEDFLAVFGPYQSYRMLRKVLEIVRKIFPFATCKPGVGRACFHYQIGLCPGVCIGAADKKEYQKTIKNLILFFRGDKKRLLAKLKKENVEAVVALKHINDVALLAESDSFVRGSTALTTRRIEGYDISHSAGKEAVGAMVVFENGEADTSQYRLFKIRGDIEEVRGKSKEVRRGYTQDDIAMLKEVVSRRLKHTEWPAPDIVFVDGGANQVRAVVAVLKQANVYVPVVGLSKGGKHAGSAYATDKLVIANAKPVGRELLAGSKKLFQEVRNEAHRFAISFHRKRTRINTDRKRMSTDKK
ncbi:MAG: hypothetical protein COU11_02200 [Candidatus Harrisonbacteria bacterium CG10_big_fil_rev_8_21_14_0_10_49_15]|uniref:Excinuclease ABC subunit C n=1 Tax=Candidatus Harrisonbacteria bacterium CG10_big_fil_rev_8_21_14_0_10_49_15 TaxID=1974587 RepID=A0A2H0UKT1_9BACT|nr:MAG: hypothetical protein COU11_02200 [Candidatus Harrisonbacteria bacterium CG10_big_fil_rev_8_21_14_0_10_49_15]